MRFVLGQLGALALWCLVVVGYVVGCVAIALALGWLAMTVDAALFPVIHTIVPTL